MRKYIPKLYYCDGAEALVQKTNYHVGAEAPVQKAPN